MKKILTLLAAGLFALLPLSACKEAETNGVTLRVNEVTHSIFYAPMYLADSLGYFEEEGIRVEFTNGGGADKVMSALLAGDADIGFCGPEAALYVLLGGSADVPTVFGQLTKRDGSFLVAREEDPDFQWTDLKGKEILAGRQGGVPAMTFEYVLKENGFTEEEIRLNYDVSFNNMTAAFLEGTAEYCTMFEPTASEVQAQGKGYIVAAVGDASGEVPYTSFIAKRSWLDKHADVAKGFLRAVMRAIEFAYSAGDEEIATYLYKQFPDTSYASISTSVKSYKRIDAWQRDMQMSKQSFDRLQDIIEAAGELPERGDFSRLTDNSFAEEVRKTLK